MSEAAQPCRRCIKISMAKRPTRISAAPIPDKLTLPALRAAAAGCKACDLWKLGTQTVFGEGSATARVMMVGEQPGDKEDLQGRPFVGPAGAVLDKALAAAGIDRKDVYVTNIVKHFKWEPRGKRRLHKKPNALEISACRPWLEAEIKVVKPEVVVLLGATAAQGIMGGQFRVTSSVGSGCSRTLRRWCWRPCILHRYCVLPMTIPAMRKCVSLWSICGESQPKSRLCGPHKRGHPPRHAP